jgi:alkylation response protein AidB-like acyl-CoA dehydrogenase
MDFSFSRETEALREEIRQFIKDYSPDEFPVQAADDFWGNGGYSYEYTRKMGEAGWLSLTWPEEWGGTGKNHPRQNGCGGRTCLLPGPERI